jgi:basic amino acid/polyamine antiporter, APA family
MTDPALSMPAEPAEPADSSEPAASGELVRAISRNTLLLLVVGDVLGAGIYALIGEVGGRIGGAIWASFMLALALALFTAFAYAELVTKYPQAAGAALYANKAWGNPFVTFLVAFTVVCSGLTSAATLSRAFGGDYLSTFVDAPVVLVAVLFLLAVAIINFRGISESAKVNVVLTAIEVGGLLLVVIVGVAAIGDGGASIDAGRALELKDGAALLPALLGGAGLAFYALIGFEDTVNLAEETREPQRAYPRALFGGLLIAGALYLVVTVVASIVVPTETLVGSSGPLLEVVQAGPLSMSPDVFSAIALFALANGALINMVMASRLVYGMAREGILPVGLGVVHGRRHTPWVAIIVTTVAAMVLAASGDLGGLADTTVLLLLVVFAVVNVAVLVLRRDPVDHPHFRTPTVLPVMGAVVSLGVMTTKDWATFTRAGILLVVGVAAWVVNWLAHGRPARTTDDAAEVDV